MEIRIATTREEREEIYRLRYEVNVEELQWDYSAADEARKQLFDEWEEAATLYYAIENGRVMASYRIHFAGDFPLAQPWREIFDLDRFAEFPEHCFSFSSRLVARPEIRGSTVVARILLKAYEEGWRRGSRFSFCWCRPRLVDLYERLGFLRYKDNVLSPAQGYVAPMVMLNEDAGHFQAVRSHFLRTCLANRPDRETAEWFDRTFPGMRTSTKKQALSPAAMCAQWGAAMSAENVTLLHGLTPAHIECLVEAGTVLRCRGGDTVLREGEPGHEMFLILEGLAHFSKQGADGAETPLRTLGSGEVFGEIALFSRIKRTASVRAVTDLQVLVISQEFLRRAMRAMPEIAMKLLYNLNAVLCERLDRTTNEWMTAIARPSTGPEKDPHATVGT